MNKICRIETSLLGETSPIENKRLVEERLVTERLVEKD